MSWLDGLGYAVDRIDALKKDFKTQDINKHDSVVVRVDEDTVFSVIRMYEDNFFFGISLYILSSDTDVSEYLPDSLKAGYIFFDERNTLASNLFLTASVLGIKEVSDTNINYDLVRKCCGYTNKKNIAVSIGTGCSRKCSFCSIAGSPVEYYPLEAVIQEIKQHLNKGAKSFHINNHSFSADLEYVKQFCAMLDAQCEEFDFKWSCFLPPEKILADMGIIGLLKKSKLDRIELGVENINADILDDFNLCVSEEEIMSIVYECEKEKIVSLVINYIVGAPMESKETIRISEEFLRSIVLRTAGYVDINLFFFYPDTHTKYRDACLSGSYSFDPRQCIGRKHDVAQSSRYLDASEIYNWKSNFSKEIYFLRRDVFADLSPKQRIDNMFLIEYGIPTQLWQYYRLSNLATFFEYDRTHKRYFFLDDVLSGDNATHFTGILYKAPVVSEDEKYLLPVDPVISKDAQSIDISEYHLYELLTAKQSIADVFRINMESSRNPEEVSRAITSKFMELENAHLITYDKILN